MRSGGCCKSASITQTQVPLATRAAATTAPPSPLTRSSGARCTSVMRMEECGMIRAITSAVSSSLSSAKMTSSGMLSASVSRRSTSSGMLPASFFVGITTETSGLTVSSTGLKRDTRSRSSGPGGVECSPSKDGMAEALG